MDKFTIDKIAFCQSVKVILSPDFIYILTPLDMLMIEIIKASFPEIPVIQTLAYSIWPLVYKDIITIEQIDYMLKTRYNNLVLEQQMKTGQQFFIAKNGNDLLGYSAVAPTDKEGLFKLEKLYVIPKNHKTGVGTTLLQTIEQFTIDSGGNALILQVNRNNAAVGFYKKMGFKIDRSEEVVIGNGFFMNDFFMIKNLVK